MASFSTILPYLYQYVKTNKLTAYCAIFLLVISFIKYTGLLKRLPSKKVLVFIILTVGLVLRIAWCNFSSHTPQMTWNPKHMLENDLVNVHAIELTKGIWFHASDGDPSGRRPIGYPLLVGLIYKIFGVHLTAVWILQLLLFVVTAYLIYLLGRATFSEAVGLLAMTFFALYPTSIYSIKLITDEHLLLPLWYLGLYFLLKETKTERLPWAWLWYGLIFGYATMTRTHTIFMPAVIFLAYLLKKIPWRTALVTMLLTFLTMQLLNLPWMVRNYRAWGVPVVYTATASFVYAQVNSTAKPEGEGHIPKRGEPGFSEELEKAKNEGEIHQISNRLMKKWIIEHPQEFAVLGISRLLVFMNWDRHSGVWPIWFQYYEGSFDPAKPLSKKSRKTLEDFAFSAYYILLFSSLFSLPLIIRRWKKFPDFSRSSLIILGSCFCFWFAEHLIIYPDRKYRFPLEPLMMIAACYFLDYLLRTFRWENLIKKVANVLPKGKQ